MRQRIEDSVAYGLDIRTKLRLTGNPTTLGGNISITEAHPSFLQYDAGGSSRNLTFPTRAASNDFLVWLVSNISTAGENLVLKDAGASTFATVPSGGMGLVVASGTSEAPGTRGWAAVILGGEDLTVTDDLAVTGDLTVGGSANIGNAAADLLGFYNGTGITQRASSNQASTNCTTSASFGATQAGAVTEIQATLTALGLWKGAA